MAYKGKKSPCKVEGIMAGEQVLEFGPGDGIFKRGKGKKSSKKSFKSCTGFYKDGQCYRDRAAYRATKKYKKGKS